MAYIIIFKIYMWVANLLLFISVHVCVGGGGNKAYSLHITKNDIYTYIYFKIMIS